MLVLTYEKINENMGMVQMHFLIRHFLTGQICGDVSCDSERYYICNGLLLP